ncbi:hypothetical protein BXZ70DRAFT_1002101 [Cristinia sonorae]|uniref:Protein-S-isoprenylcysteine O-methyltransferase n=1 Tax=Cristinia sonorae TaxID=1940300 RepID=A0A8K0UIR6_9AGAR|nr:hypothetical protein BXZ70DRAFT_1002101 [Cristinia sonorae]
MSLLRALLLCIQVPCYQVASTPPNKSPTNGRYDASTPWHLRIASSVIQAQQPIVWTCTLADLLLILAQRAVLPVPVPVICPFPNPPSAPPSLRSPHPLNGTFLSPSPPTTLPSPHIHATLLSLLGLALVLFGSLLRAACYRALGALFTFDLSIQPRHKLVTWGPYAYVRHPAYSGSLSLMLGLALVNLTPGSWLAECGVLGLGNPSLNLAVRALLFLTWYAWWISVGVHRAVLEDQEMKKLFGDEWVAYSKRVPCWFIPGVF